MSLKIWLWEVDKLKPPFFVYYKNSLELKENNGKSKSMRIISLT